jgi:hypothetical protein
MHTSNYINIITLKKYYSTLLFTFYKFLFQVCVFMPIWLRNIWHMHIEFIQRLEI